MRCWAISPRIAAAAIPPPARRCCPIVENPKPEEQAMKRLHVHVAVDDLDQSIRFYATLFAAEPSVVKPDYAKWMLTDPRVNFAISARGHGRAGLDHLGIQTEDEAELVAVQGRLKCAEGPVLDEGLTTCCYAK